MGHDQKKLNSVFDCPKVVFAYCGTDEDREVSASQGYISVRKRLEGQFFLRKTTRIAFL